MYFNGITSTTSKINASTTREVEEHRLLYENHLNYVICGKRIAGLSPYAGSHVLEWGSGVGHCGGIECWVFCDP